MKTKILSLLIVVLLLLLVLTPESQANSEITEENRVSLLEFQEEIKSHSREENEKNREVLLKKENKSEKELAQIEILQERIGNQKLMKRTYKTIGFVLFLCVSVGFSAIKI